MLGLVGFVEFGLDFQSSTRPWYWRVRAGSGSFAGDAGWRARQGTRPTTFTGLALDRQPRVYRPCPQHQPARDIGVGRDPLGCVGLC